jgi:hypothetical protein
MGLSVLHFANLRLGAAAPSLGLRGRDLRARLLRTLEGLGTLAAAEHVQAVLISGDLFGCGVPAPETLAAVRQFFEQLRQADIAAVVLPGKRDPAGIFDRLRQPDGAELLPDAYVLGPSLPIVRLSQTNLDICYFGLPADEAEDVISHAPIVRAPDRIALALAYWSGRGAPPLARFAQAASVLGLRYLGIGGPPAFAMSTEDACTACTPGVPEPLDWGQGEGTAALLRVRSAGISVEKQQISKHRFVRRELELSPDNRGHLGTLVQQMADSDLGLELVLTGTCPAELLVDPQALERDCADGFFSLRVVDRTGLVIDTSGFGTLPQGTVLGNFARLMDTRIRSAPDEEEATLNREGYRIAMHLLQGGRGAS